MGEELPLPFGAPERPPENRHEQAQEYGGVEKSNTLNSVENKSTHDRESKESLTVSTAGPVPVKNNTVVQNATDDTTLYDDATTGILDQVPVVAADEDVIEKQWVDVTKKVIAQTKSDPYAQARAIGRLHKDYLMKRYGKEMKLNEDKAA